MFMPAAVASGSTNDPNLFNTPQAGFIVLAIVVVPVGFMLVFVAEVLYFRYLERKQVKAELAALSVQLQLQGRNTGSSTVSTQRPRWKRLLIATRATLAFNRPFSNARPATKHRTNPRLSTFDLLESGNLPSLSPPLPALIKTRQLPYMYPLDAHRYSKSTDSSGTYYKAGSLGLGLSRANSNSMDARPLSVSGTYSLCLGPGIGLGFDLRPPPSAPSVQGTIASSRDSFGARPAYDFDEKAFVDVDMDADVDAKGKDELGACTGTGTGTVTPPPALPPTVALPTNFRVSGSPISIDIAQCATLVSPPRYPSRYGYI